MYRLFSIFFFYTRTHTNATTHLRSHTQPRAYNVVICTGKKYKFYKYIVFLNTTDKNKKKKKNKERKGEKIRNLHAPKLVASLWYEILLIRTGHRLTVHLTAGVGGVQLLLEIVILLPVLGVVHLRHQRSHERRIFEIVRLAHRGR